MVSLRRRQVIIGGLASTLVPAIAFASPEKLILSGRIVGWDGRPLAGAFLASGDDRTVADADGRFLLVTTTRTYGVTCNGQSTEGIIANQRRDANGTWRATVGLTLA